MLIVGQPDRICTDLPDQSKIPVDFLPGHSIEAPCKVLMLCHAPDPAVFSIQEKALFRVHADAAKADFLCHGICYHPITDQLRRQTVKRRVYFSVP